MRKKKKNTVAEEASPKLKYEPIVFMNTPISDDSGDVIGINSAVQSVKSAINEDAKMIGVIADYGAGKSSLTETIAKDTETFGKIIRINMWDSVPKKDSDKNETVSKLIKSFVYQLASGVSKHCAQYANRRLSKNYGILSFSVSSWGVWKYAIFSSLCYFVFAAISLLKVEEINSALLPLLDKFLESTLTTASVIIKASAPFFLVLGIVLAVIGLRNTSIAFSHWKSDKEKESEVNDVFETYSYVHKQLLKGKKKMLVIVEDLDRINDKSVVVDFIKEIYRFSSLLIPKNKKTPVFLVSVMPESCLKDGGNENCSCVYSKLFDYTVSLKPIHYEDYAKLVLEILGDENSANRVALQNLFDEEKGEKITNESLPKSFNWILEGHNLTIRQLKDRLNSAVFLFVTLKNKGYKNESYIDFASCAAVTYLEHQYPDLFFELLKKEDVISELVREKYRANNAYTNESVEICILDKLKELLKDVDEEKFKNIVSFREDLAKMILQGDICEDFRVYFYSFPKNSYIKNSDERDVCNLLLWPNEYISDEKLDEKIKRLMDSGKIDTISKTLKTIGANNDVDKFPEIVFEHGYLFKTAYKINKKKVHSALIYYASWEENQFDLSKKILENLLLFTKNDNADCLDNYAVWLSKRFYSLENQTRIKIRKQIISICKERIGVFCGLFKDNTVSTGAQVDPDAEYTIISEDELSMMSSRGLSVESINIDLIDENNFRYILNYINAEESKSNQTLFQKMLDVYTAVVKKIDATNCWREIIEFLIINQYVDNDLFGFAINGGLSCEGDKGFIADYLSGLPVETITNEYLLLVNKNVIDNKLSNELCELLYVNKLFTTLLSFLAKQKLLSHFDFTIEENNENLLEALDALLVHDESLWLTVRTEIVRQFAIKDSLKSLKSRFENIFYGNYPIITKDEMSIIPNIIYILLLLNRTKVTLDNFGALLSEINDKTEKSQCLKVFDLLLNREYDDEYTDKSIVINIVSRIDYQKIGISELDDDEIKEITDLIGEYYDFSNYANAITFMDKAKLLFPELEKIVVGKNKEYYIELINRVDMPSSFTMNWLETNKVSFGLPQNILRKLLDKKLYRKYLIGKVLKEHKLIFSDKNVPSKVVVDEYTPKSPIWKYVKDNYLLACYIIENQIYKKFYQNELPILLPPLYSGKQDAEFFEFVLDNVNTSDKSKYLCSMGEIVDDENRMLIYNFLCEDSHMKLLEKEEVFKCVESRLWDNAGKKVKNYRGALTRKRRNYLKG